MEQFHVDTVERLEEHALFTAERLSAIPGLRVVEPQVRRRHLYGGTSQ